MEKKFLIVALIPIFFWVVFMVIFLRKHILSLQKVKGRYTEPDLLFKFFQKRIPQEQFSLMKNFFLILYTSMLILSIIEITLLTLTFGVK